MASTAAYTTRLAPSPTGALHLGNARTFVITWLRARARGGRVLLRMEDLDHPKIKPWAVDQAYEDLAWLGLDWDDGPPESFPFLDKEPVAQEDVAGPFVQSQRTPRYREAFEQLRQKGLVYPCTCSRKDIESAQSAPHVGEDLVYPGTCRDRYRDEEHARAESERDPAWRFRMPHKIGFFLDGFHGMQRQALWEAGDFVVAKAGGEAAYQLAVVVDDAAMGVTEVIRADDLLGSTHKQLALYMALNLPAPAFLHVPLVVGPDGRRLAKRHGDTRLSHIREAGTPPEAVLGWIAHSCGWTETDDAVGVDQLLDRFGMDTIPKGAVVVDASVRERLGVA